MSDLLDKLAAYVRSQGWNTYSVSVAVGDKEPETVELIPANPCQDIYSGAKAYAMTGIGLLFDKGLLSVDEKICDIFADELPSGMDERWLKCTVDMALRHRLGLPGGFLDIDCQDPRTFGEDYLEFMFKTPLVYEPDCFELYSDGAYYLLSRIVTKKTGTPLDDFLRKELLYKLGFIEIAMSHCPLGHAIGATGLYVRSNDNVKLGQLYLNRGLYRGERLLSEKWIDLALEREYCFEWDKDHLIYFKGGMHGQKIVVAPGLNAALCMQSYGANGDLFVEFIARCARS